MCDELPGDTDETYARFVCAHTAESRVPFVALTLRLATEVTPLWHATEAWLRAHDVPPPFWAFAWAGGLALGRHLLEVPDLVRGRRVLDFATGSGLVAICAARAGAAHVRAVDIDPFAMAAARANAQRNGVRIATVAIDVIGDIVEEDVVLCGDVLYDKDLASRVTPWLRALANAGKVVLVGDPGRTYAQVDGTRLEATYDVPTPEELEGRPSLVTSVRRVLPA